MTKHVKVAVIVGSQRKQSINRQLANALKGLAPESLQFIDISLDDLPMYNADLEPNRPDAVNTFVAECARADAFLIVMPEHNRSVPAVLKNAIDWGSKPMDKNVWRDKPVAITGTTPGAIGTAVGQQHLRQIMGILGSAVLGGEAYITFKPDMVDANHQITDAGTRDFLKAYIDRFANFAVKLSA
ncbi:MAG: NAD(P)H-dependent oxidoreductase [Alcaligenaceae bacterium]|nr:NAD(P)H-dependent oxidoreductase [Alcaligenaceae bacterium]